MKTKHFITVLLWLLAAVSCQNDDWKTNSHKNYIRVFANPLTLTRVYLSQNDSVTYADWEEGDEIYLYSKKQGRLCYQYNVPKDESGFIEFKPLGNNLEAEEGDTIYACFLGNYLPGSDMTKVNINKYSDFLYAKGVIVNQSLYLSFKHLYAYVYVNLANLSFDELPNRSINVLLKGEDDDVLRVEGTFDLTTEKLAIENANTGVDQFIEPETIAQQGLISCYLPLLPQPEGTFLQLSYTIDGSTLELFEKAVPKGGMEAGHVYTFNMNSEKVLQELELQRKALEALYKATDGDHWLNNTNWLSDKPIYEWYGVNNNEWGGVWKSPYVIHLNLRENGLNGELPEEFTTLMNTAISIDLAFNKLRGVIPENIRTHEKWNKFGWNILQQNIYSGGRFDMTNINLRANDMTVEYLNGGTTTLYSLLAKNKVSHIMIDTPSDAQANQHLSYHNKGFGTIIFHSGVSGETREATIARTKDYPIKDIVHLWESAGTQLGEGLSILGSTYLLDNQGYVIDYLTRDWDISEEAYNTVIDSILYARLGDPEEHPIFSTEYYTSSDYSRDGEVVTLQTASTGKGINLVLMGDAYVDRDMEDGGKYEEDMKKSMEYFFSIEPYKSFRNRFNVYTVKVISETEYMSQKLDKMQLRLGAFNETGTNYFSNDDICFEYAGKVNGVDLDKVTIINVVNNPNLFRVGGYTNMYASGASIGHIYMGGPSNIIVHESGGHGFAKLLDEYVYEGAAPTMSETDKADFNTNYTTKGWGANLDVTNSPTEVKWAHLLADPLYKDEIGIYEGAWLWIEGIYRPSINSVMNKDYTWFNAPSREAIYKAIMQQSEGNDWIYHYEDFVAYDAINRGTTPVTRSFRPKDKRKVIHRTPVFVKVRGYNTVKSKRIIAPF